MSFYPNPEPVFAALWSQVAGLPDFNYLSRRWKHWSSMSPDQQPAIFQVQTPARTIQFMYENKQPVPALKFYAEWVIYCRTEETLETPPATNINSLVAKAIATLEPPFQFQGQVRKPLLNPSGQEVVFNARIIEISIVEGVGGDSAQSLAFIPIELTRPV